MNDQTDRREGAPATLADLIEMAQKFTPPIPRELHVRNREALLRITGAEVQANPGMGIHVAAGLPVYYDDAMPNNVMEMRHAETGEVLRRWFLTPDGELFSFNPGELRWRDEKFGMVQP